MKKILIAAIALCCLSVVAAAQKLEIVTVLKGNDPVELVEGREVSGQQSLSVVRGKYRYLFASEANKKSFEKSPDEYQIQLGGGCGRMGSLSGAGNPDRYYVFNRKIYIFASEQCRNGFKAAPENHFEGPDAIPTGTVGDKKRGQELINLALKGMGGAKAVDTVKTWQANIVLSYPQGDKVTEYKQTQTIAFPGRFRNEYDWGGSLDATVLVPGKATSISSKEIWVREEPVRAAMERELYRNPLAILKARREPGFVAYAAGSGTAGDAQVEFLKVAYKGATTTLSIDSSSGRILQVAYRDRKGAFGDLVRTFMDFKTVDGLTLPFRMEESFNGKAVTSPSVRVESVAINGKVDPKLF